MVTELSASFISGKFLQLKIQGRNEWKGGSSISGEQWYVDISSVK
jgi:hypothetical protein